MENYFNIQFQPKSHTEEADAHQSKAGNKTVLNPSEACLTMLEIIEDRPIHHIHLRNFQKQFYLDSQVMTPQIMFNIGLRCKDPQQKYGSLGNVPMIRPMLFLLIQV